MLVHGFGGWFSGPGSCLAVRDSVQPHATRMPALPHAARPVATSAATNGAQSVPHRAVHGGAPSQAWLGSALPVADAAHRAATQAAHSFSACRALVLDSSYRPIDVVNWQRAICLDLFDKVDVLEYYDTYVRSSSAQFLIPAVLRVRMYVSAKEVRSGRLTLSRRNIMLRDKCTCQYCGVRQNLTVDHVVPLSKGGKWAWENLVTACTRCNGRKGDKSLKQLGWRLETKPVEPSPYQMSLLLNIEMNQRSPPKEWSDYLFPLSWPAGYTDALPNR
ncbi:hypothetical protein WJX81_002968 [Elliptochloris bilobata]|uniref:HNH nuclease domain-containing protein n=1 Tax=Elliptochloris bilobata TaxID=381761 RepID=A0AAW1S1H0_9CHLO